MISRLIRDALQERTCRRLNLRGDNCWRDGDTANAEKYFRAAIATGKGSSSLAMSNLGMLLFGTHRYDEGFSMLLRAAEINQHHPGILINLGNGYFRSGQIAKCIEKYTEALRLDPGNRFAIANLLRPLMETCNWNAIEALLDRIRGLMATSKDNQLNLYVSAFNSLFLPFTRKEQLNIATDTSKSYEGFVRPLFHEGRLRQQLKKRNERIRIAYLSSDFHNHPTAHLTLGIFGKHDRNRFEVYCYSIGYPDESTFRKRIAADCDKFVDVHSLGVREIAQRIYHDEIDILIDMKG
jgi:protein O-GlcNAc transferase